ncbi:MAG TPA: cytochrome ubiquinol oxidase subunit I, partial [Acidimicrobiales bacterium]|nr:cytochrome ubiquinol oxidase subunit I [Acidimicrobiales bacterium]
VIWILYWSFRVMVGLGFLLLALGAIGLWLMKKRRLETSNVYLRFATWMALAPFIANSVGWIFTEVGRQPWVVYGLLKTSNAVTLIAPGYVAASFIGFTAIYTLLAIVEIGLLIRLARVPTPLTEGALAPEPELIY